MAQCKNHQGTTINLQCTQCKNSGDSQFPNIQTMAKAPRKRKDPNPSLQNFANGSTTSNPSQNHNHCNICHTASNVHSSKRSNSMAQYCSGISKPIYCQILAILPNKDDSQILATQKIVESDPSKTENSPRKTIIPHPAPLVSGNFITPSGPATANIVATSKSKKRSGNHPVSAVLSPPHTQNKTGQRRIGMEKYKKQNKKKRRRTKTKVESRGTGQPQPIIPQAHNTSQLMK